MALAMSALPVRESSFLASPVLPRRSPPLGNNVLKHGSKPVPRVRASASENKNTNFLTLFCPLLKLIGGGDAASPRNRFQEVLTSGLASLSRLKYGVSVRPTQAGVQFDKDLQPIQLYEFEACPFCRRVRETLTELDLVADIYPCPKDAVRHRDIVLARGGKAMFPYMIDPNTGVAMYESADIVKYLYRTYGGGEQNLPDGFLTSTLVTGWMPTLLRAGRGMARYSGADVAAPAQKLELWNYEGNQFARLVREALCELELPYRLMNVGKGSKRREQLAAITGGSTTVPYLVDPNSGLQIQDSQEAVRYLFTMYSNAGARPPA